jgi:hypothetical protein
MRSGSSRSRGGRTTACTRGRLAGRELQDRTVMKKLFDDLGARFAARPGGYTRILRLGPRRGDGAEMAIVELIGSEYKPEKKGDEKGKKGAAPSAKGEGEGAEKPSGKTPAAKGARKGGRKKPAEPEA